MCEGEGEGGEGKVRLYLRGSTYVGYSLIGSTYTRKDHQRIAWKTTW